MEQVDLFEMISGPTEQAILKALKSDNLSKEKIKEFTESLINDGSRKLASGLKKTAPEMLAKEREFINGFVERCYARWKAPIDLLRIIRTASQEIAECHAHKGPEGIDPITFVALAHLQPKALLITNEILWLLEGGYADAALARWRTLHEVVVTAMFIAKHGADTARDYRYSEVFTNRRAAGNLNVHSQRARIERFSDAELEAMDRECEAAEAAIGRKLKGEFDWAGPALKSKSSQVRFAQIETDVGMDHWRPRYKWACQHSHAGFSGPQKLLGMSEAKQFMFQVGPSNSGFVDPLHMTAISLHQMTSTFLLSGTPDLGRVVYVTVIGHLVDELGPLSVNVEKVTREKAANQREVNSFSPS